MKIWMFAFVISTCLAASVMADAPPGNSFPDKSLGVSEVKVTSFTDWVAKLHEYTGKTVVLPDGVEAAMSKSPSANALFVRGLSRTEKPGEKSEPLKLSEFVNATLMIAGLKWRYDSGKGAFILSFPWETNDDRANAELLKILASTKLGDQIGKPDPWREAFNGLAGKPENRTIAWVTRWLGEETQGFVDSTGQISNQFAGNLLDGAGQSHLLILNVHFSTIPGLVYASYYLFDRNGKIEEAGVLNAGGTNYGASFEDRGVLNDTGTRMTYRGLEFKVEKSHLILVSKPADDPNHIGETVLVLDAPEAAHK